jgi:hypothetical protein
LNGVTGERAPEPSRFFRIPRGAAAVAVAGDLSELLRRGGGQTQYGYVERARLDAARPLRFAAFDPLLRQRESALRRLGDVRPLGDLYRVQPGAAMRDTRVLNFEGDGIPMVNARALRHNMPLSELPRVPQSAVHADMLLRAGDICVPRLFTRNGLLNAVRIGERDLPLTAHRTVLVLRPKSLVEAEAATFLVDYLSSERARGLLSPSHEFAGHEMLDPSDLRSLLVPGPDSTLLATIRDLRNAQARFARWATDVQQAISDLFSDATDDGSVLAVRSSGGLLRQRAAAAQQLDDLGYRVRNLFPFPVSLPWRRATSASRDLEGYVSVLECAESLTAYLAALAILLARSIGHELGAVAALREKLHSTRHGVSMADWAEIVREVSGRKVRALLTEEKPFVELSDLMAERSIASESLRNLTGLRNDQSHNRGPKGGQVPNAFDRALVHLEELYDSCQWLSDYPLRVIETVNWDSYKARGSYTYRELVGDHYLVSERTAETPTLTLDRGRLYVCDRESALHLISPLIIWHECDTCGMPSAFFVDGINQTRDQVRMRASDHNHVIHRADAIGPLAQIGLLHR